MQQKNGILITSDASEIKWKRRWKNSQLKDLGPGAISKLKCRISRDEPPKSVRRRSSACLWNPFRVRFFTEDLSAGNMFIHIQFLEDKSLVFYHGFSFWWRQFEKFSRNSRSIQFFMKPKKHFGGFKNMATMDRDQLGGGPAHFNRACRLPSCEVGWVGIHPQSLTASLPLKNGWLED